MRPAARTHARSRQGFSLLETVLVLALVGVISALFIPVLGGSAGTSAILSARASVSAVVDTTARVYQHTGPTPAAPCPNVPDTDPQVDITNEVTFVDPCTLQDTAPDLGTILPATTPSTTPEDVSVGAVHTTGSWRTATVALAATGQQPTNDGTCQGLVRHLPGGHETYVAYPSGPLGCDSATILTADVSACSTTTSWATVCVLPGPQ